MDTALSFDLDWMRGQSVGVFPVANSGPEPVIAELEKIVDSGENGLSQNMIKFQPMARLNAIMVVSKKPALLRTAATWIKRLDRSDSSRTSVHVYRVKYGEARQIARVLTDMFGGGSSSGGLLDSADNQLAPGSGLSASGSLSQNGTNSTSHRDRAAWFVIGRHGFGSSSSGGFGSSSSGFGARPGSGTSAGGAPGAATRARPEAALDRTAAAAAAVNRCCKACGSRPTPSTTPC